jgi:hypothetical protein
MSPTLGSKFARMEYAGDLRFHVAYLRHAGKWWLSHRDLTSDEAIETIRDHEFGSRRCGVRFTDRSPGRFDRQETTEFHLDGAPDRLLSARDARIVPLEGRRREAIGHPSIGRRLFPTPPTEIS